MSKRILLVDDDPDLIDLYQPYLQQKGYEVEAAYTLDEAKEKFTEFDPDIVLTDLVMEHFDTGFIFCHWISKQPKREQRWIVIFTSTGHETGYRFSTKTKEEKRWINADDYLEKPIVNYELLQYIEEKAITALEIK